MHVVPLEAFRDNYIWLIRPAPHDRRALVVDPGDARPVVAALESQGLELRGILVTHHHHDHVGGIVDLLHWARSRQVADVPVWGPGDEDIPGRTIAVGEGDSFTPPGWDCRLDVIAVPGHTLGHLAYVMSPPPGSAIAPALFCGDTLFSAGCGRLFEGSPAQMADSLNKLRRLPENTTVNCAHEYTISNLQFARVADPSNARVLNHLAHCQALRANGRPTLPSTIGLEKQINPFLRTSDPGVLRTLEARVGRRPKDAVEALAWLREWKNEFKG